MIAIRQGTVALPTFGETLLVMLTYFLCQFSGLALGDYLPLNRPALWAAVASTFGAAFGASLVAEWLARRRGASYLAPFAGSLRPRGCFAVGAAIAVAVQLLTLAFPPATHADPMLGRAFLDNGGTVLAAWILSVVAIAPLGEEMVFRGALLAYLQARFRASVAVVASAALFALVHMPQLHAYWPAILGIFALGVGAGYARWRSGSVLAAIVVHMSYNAVLMAFLFAGRV